ncbi:MAG: NAD(P)H-binding protein [Elusimicrobia bacterium]|nr:NAD(P)H-binding protein [Elusimicrobiota bacterium]
MKIAVTGAFGYSGRYIAKRLLDAGHGVITPTNSLRRENPFGGRVQAFPFDFDQPDRLRASLAGVDGLINTYWVRFDHRLFTHRAAVENTKVLFKAAKEAGVRRIVHVSITNPDIDSALPYFRGKAELEAELASLGLSYCVLRPTVLFGKEDVLVNNMAWALRRFPVFGVFGSGDYRLQPIHVDDLASAAVEKVLGSGSEIVNAIGPETFTYRGLVETVRNALGLKRLVIGVPPVLGYWACALVGMLVDDVVVTQEEIQGLMEGRLYVDAPALGKTKLSEWIVQHRDTLGLRYTSELARRTDRVSSYRSN